MDSAAVIVHHTLVIVMTDLPSKRWLSGWSFEFYFRTFQQPQVDMRFDEIPLLDLDARNGAYTVALLYLPDASKEEAADAKSEELAREDAAD